MTAELTRDELEGAWCWDPSDRVPRRPAMTLFRQSTRLHQARWREAHGHPIGSQPFVPRSGIDSRPVGNRIPFDYGLDTGATFVTLNALAAARARTSLVERHQSFDRQRLWAELLSSEALAFNLFGDLWADRRRADDALRAWWPDIGGRVSEVRFAHSPGRLDAEWLNSLRAFDAAFVVDRGNGTHGVLAVDVTYHERLTREQPKPTNLARYREVHERFVAFRPDAFDAVSGRTDLWSPWLEHLLLLSMLQHPSGDWTWGRYIVVHAAGNTDMADMCARYRELLADTSTFDSITIEDLVGAAVLPPATVARLRERYLP